MKKHVKKLWFSLPFPLWFEPKEVSLVQVWSSKHDAFPERNQIYKKITSDQKIIFQFNDLCLVKSFIQSKPTFIEKRNFISSHIIFYFLSRNGKQKLLPCLSLIINIRRVKRVIQYYVFANKINCGQVKTKRRLRVTHFQTRTVEDQMV